MATFIVYLLLNSVWGYWNGQKENPFLPFPSLTETKHSLRRGKRHKYHYIMKMQKESNGQKHPSLVFITVWIFAEWSSLFRLRIFSGFSIFLFSKLSSGSWNYSYKVPDCELFVVVLPGHNILRLPWWPG